MLNSTTRPVITLPPTAGMPEYLAGRAVAIGYKEGSMPLDSVIEIGNAQRTNSHWLAGYRDGIDFYSAYRTPSEWAAIAARYLNR
jgi:hypothetical protein